MCRIFDNDSTWFFIMAGLVAIVAVICSYWKDIESERIAPQMASQGYEQVRELNCILWKKKFDKVEKKAEN